MQPRGGYGQFPMEYSSTCSHYSGEELSQDFRCSKSTIMHSDNTTTEEASMQLQSKLKILRHLNELSHKVALWLVAASFAADVLGRFDPSGRTAESALNGALNVVHWAALLVVVVILFLRFGFERNAGRDLARLLKESIDPNGPPLPARNLRPFYSRLPATTANDVAFVTSSKGNLADILYTLNFEAFDNSRFGLKFDEVCKRDGELITKNPKAFLLVWNRASRATAYDSIHRQDEFIGYTCVLPLNKTGANLYLQLGLDCGQRPSTYPRLWTRRTSERCSCLRNCP